eukprot:369123_1
MIINEGLNYIIKEIKIETLKTFIDDNNKSIIIAVYGEKHSIDKLTEPFMIDMPPNVINKYKPNVVTIDSIKAIQENDMINIYWDHPQSLYGTVTYNVILDTPQKPQQIIDYFPFQISYYKLPIIIKIITLCSIEYDTGLKLDYDSVQTAPVLITTRQLQSREKVEIYNGKLPHFLQIRKLSFSKFYVQLTLGNWSPKRALFDVKEISRSNSMKMIVINQNESHNAVDIYFQEEHVDDYAISVYEHTSSEHNAHPIPVTNIITLKKYPFTSYPPSNNDNYIPQ